HEEGVTVTISKNGAFGILVRSSGSWIPAGFAVGQELALGPVPGVSATANVNISSDRLTRRDGLTWAAAGFAVGQQVTIDGVDGTRVINGFGDSATYGTGTVLLLTGQAMSALPNVTATVTAVTNYIGVVNAITDTTLTLNLALSV